MATENNELRFAGPSKNDKKKLLQINDELESKIDYKPITDDVYDGPRLAGYVMDELGMFEYVPQDRNLKE